VLRWGVVLDDTSDSARAYLDARLRTWTPAQRLARVFGLTEVTHALALADLRRGHPEASDEDLRLALAERLWPPELFAAFVAWRRARAGATAGRTELIDQPPADVRVP
jgi:hypothetical protein